MNRMVGACFYLCICTINIQHCSSTSNHVILKTIVGSEDVVNIHTR